MYKILYDPFKFFIHTRQRKGYYYKCNNLYLWYVIKYMQFHLIALPLWKFGFLVFLWHLRNSITGKQNWVRQRLSRFGMASRLFFNKYHSNQNCFDISFQERLNIHIFYGTTKLFIQGFSRNFIAIFENVLSSNNVYVYCNL